MTRWIWHGCMADDRVIQRSDYSVSCLDSSGSVTAGKSRVVSEYQNSVRIHHCYLQSRIDETVRMETCMSLYGQYKCSDNPPFLQFGTPQCALNCTYSLLLQTVFPQRPTTHVRHVILCRVLGESVCRCRYIMAQRN